MNALLRLTLVLVLAAGTGCSRNNSAVDSRPLEPPPQSFELRGLVRGIDFADRSLILAHEEIPGYMPAMTMPFNVKEMAEVESLKIGDAVAGKLIVTENNSWVESLKKISASDVRVPKRVPSGKGEHSSARLEEGDLLPNFHLVDDRGRTFALEAFRGKKLFLTFIFTRCPIPNYCPLMSENFRAISDAIANDPELREQTRFLSISFDAEFDTPEVLAQYGERYTSDHDRWRFATGSKAVIDKLTAAFAIHIRPEAGTLSHGLATALVGPDGSIRKIWRGNSWKPEEALAALRES